MTREKRGYRKSIILVPTLAKNGQIKGNTKRRCRKQRKSVPTHPKGENGERASGKTPNAQRNIKCGRMARRMCGKLAGGFQKAKVRQRREFCRKDGIY